MKKIILILFIASFYSCKKCYDCIDYITTRYEYDPNFPGTLPLPNDTTTIKSREDICDKDELKTHTTPISVQSVAPINGKIVIVTVTAHSSCVEN